MRSAILCILLLIGLLSSCQSNSKSSEIQTSEKPAKNSISEIVLKTITEKDTLLKGIVHNQASVFIFLSPECPLCKGYSTTLNDLYKKYKNNNITFCGVFPGTLYPIEEIRDFQKYYSIDFPIIIDTAFSLSHLLDATVTPEAFVTDSTGTILYTGRIDNWAYDVSKKRQNISEHNLDDALTAIVNNTAIAVTKTKAIGCFIEEPPQK